MSRVPRNVLLAVTTLLIFVAVAAAVDLQIVFQSRATQSVWTVTQSVAAGDKLSGDNVRQVQLPVGGTSWNFYTGDLARAGRRVEHQMDPGNIVSESDLMKRDTSVVTLSLKTPPPAGKGDTVDIYAVVDSRARIVGRNLPVDSTSGSNFTVVVPADDEPYWIALAANNVALYAARSQGVGVPQGGGQGVSDAISALGGGSTAPGGTGTNSNPASGGGTVPGANQQPVVSPTPTGRHP